MNLKFEEIPLRRLMLYPNTRTTVEVYLKQGLKAPRYYQTSIGTKTRPRYLFVCHGKPLIEGLTKPIHYISLSTTSKPFPYQDWGPRPSQEHFEETCKILAPGVKFEIENIGDPRCIHAFEIP